MNDRDQRFSADPEAMRESGERFIDLGSSLSYIEHVIKNVVENYPDAAGDGKLRESFDEKYLPGAMSAHELIRQLGSAVQDLADGTVSAAADFAATDDRATGSARRGRR